ncbi:MAG: hypothetical protein LT067_07630 [Sulfurovum sp.]|nr:hypothetical protein [Sulfurovum sp.]
MAFTEIIPISEIRKNIKDIPQLGGVYKHYVDKDGLAYLDGVYPTKKEISIDGIEVYLLYIGKAKDLFERYKWHLGMTNTSHKSLLGKWLSTLRLSYMANHKTIICLSEQDKLDEFMDKHTYTQYMITEDFDGIEKQLIKENDLPLNVQDNSHEFVQTNIERRKAINAKYQNEHSDGNTIMEKVNRVKISDAELIHYAKEAKNEGIQNKSRFIVWFRKGKGKKASEKRLSKAWSDVEKSII